MPNSIQLLPSGPTIGTIHHTEEVVTLDFFDRTFHLNATVFAGILEEYADIITYKEQRV